MDRFTFYAPTEIIFGKNTETEVGKICQRYGAKKILIHYGGKSAEK